MKVTSVRITHLLLIGGTDRAGDVDPLKAGGGRHHLSDAAHPAPQGHPADTHTEHGKHLWIHDGHSAS